MLNRDNFTVWKDSGFDVRVGEQLLESSYVKRWQKQAQSEASRLQAELVQMVRGCTTVPELALVVHGVSEHMAPDTLVAAISRATHLPLVASDDNHSAEVSNPRLVPELLDALLPLLQNHCGALNSGQLASVLAAISRAAYRPSATITGALRAELSGDTGLQRVDAAGPGETAALMLALARLRWGGGEAAPELWGRLGEAVLAQLGEMAPSEIARALRGASLAPDAASSETLGPSSLLWVHAEQVVTTRISEFGHRELSQTLLAFATIGATACAKLRTAVDARLTAGQWPSVPPQALVDYARASARLLALQQRAAAGMVAAVWGADAAASSMLQQACGAATHAVTQLDVRQIEQLLQAVRLAYGSSGSSRSVSGNVPVVVQQLLGLVADVLRIRGFQGMQAGAVPPPSAATAASGNGSQEGAVACRVLLLLAQLGHFSSAATSPAPSPLLRALLHPGRKLLEGGRLNPEAAAALLQAYAQAATSGAAPAGGTMQLAGLAAGAMERGAASMSAAAAAQALTALTASASEPPPPTSPPDAHIGPGMDAVKAACLALADRLAGSGEVAGGGRGLSRMLGLVALGELKGAMAQGGAAAGLAGHKLNTML